MTSEGERALIVARRASVDQPQRRASEPLLERGFLIFIGVSLALVVACLPFALQLDARTDRQGPMYSDLTLMAWLQHVNLRDEGAVVPRTFSHGASATVGGHRFEVSPGVTIRVRPAGDGFCVRASNQFGDVTKWYCHDLHDPPERVSLSGE